MGEIIIPGQKKPHIYDDIRRVANNENWNPQLYLQEQYQMFLAAVQQEASKDYKYNSELQYITAGSPKWNESDTFNAWLKDTKDMVAFRIKELAVRREQSSKSFPHIISLVREAQDAGQANMTIDGIGEQMQTSDYEMFEFILKKSLETISEFEKGLIVLEAPELTSEEAKELEKTAKRLKKLE